MIWIIYIGVGFIINNLSLYLFRHNLTWPQTFKHERPFFLLTKNFGYKFLTVQNK